MFGSHLLSCELLISLLTALLFNCCGGLNCYSCVYSLIDPSQKADDNYCANETLVSLDKTKTVRPCAAWEKFCVTTVLTSQDTFSSVTRNCAEECSDSCDMDGYGTDMARCSDCCDTDLCNDKSSLKYYTRLMDGRHTSWTEPVDGEREYNKKAGIRFPY